MARIVNGRLLGQAARLDASERRRAQRRIARQAARNPLRTVHLACHGWLRDPVAVVGDWLWCDACGDHRRVDALRE